MWVGRGQRPRKGEPQSLLVHIRGLAGNALLGVALKIYMHHTAMACLNPMRCSSAVSCTASWGAVEVAAASDAGCCV